MNLKEIMNQHSFAVLGNTLDESKYACQIKNGLIEKGYQVYSVGKELESINDIDGNIDIVDLCIHPAKGLRLLKECRKPFRMIVVQPGASDDELIAYLEDNNIPYINGCLLIGLKLYS